MRVRLVTTSGHVRVGMLTRVSEEYVWLGDYFYAWKDVARLEGPMSNKRYQVNVFGFTIFWQTLDWSLIVERTCRAPGHIKYGGRCTIHDAARGLRATNGLWWPLDNGDQVGGQVNVIWLCKCGRIVE